MSLVNLTIQAHFLLASLFIGGCGMQLMQQKWFLKSTFLLPKHLYTVDKEIINRRHYQ